MPELPWYAAALTLSAVLAVFFGQARERAAVLVFAGLGAAWVVARTEPRPHAAAWILMILDLTAAAWLAKVAWKASKTWPVWALAAEAVAAAASLAFLLQPDVGAQVWLRGLFICRLAAVLALCIGTSRRTTSHS